MRTYVPGLPGKLEKALIVSTEEPNKTMVEALFNPKEITIDKPVPWQKHKGVENESPILEFTAAEPKTLVCELMFDLFEQRQNVYVEKIEPLESLALIDPTLKRPPVCLFIWGNLPRFQGVIENLNVKYTLFLPDGSPCRAVVTLKMKQATSALKKEEKAEAQKKPKQGRTSDSTLASTQAARLEKSHRQMYDDADKVPDRLGNLPTNTHVA